MQPASLVYYVTGHGYGHATRAAAALASLRVRAPRLPIVVRTTAPGWIFAPVPGVRYDPADMDPGLLQKDAIESDLEASLPVHEAILARWEELVEAEAAFLRAERAGLVVADIPPLAFAAAAAAGVPAWGLGNFSWDWIFETYADEEPRWGPMRERYARAYSGAELLLRVPMAAPLEAFRRREDIPLLVRRSRLTEEGARRHLGLSTSETRPVVLVSFSNWGHGLADLSAGDDLSGFLFAGAGPKPPGLRADWLPLRSGDPAAHLDALPACAAILSKPGYGVVSESLAHGVRLLYVPRTDFPETAVLVEGFLRLGCGGALPPEEFRAGRWRARLEALLARPVPPPPDCTGAEAFASRVLGALKA